MTEQPDVYNRSTFEKNAIQGAPDGYAEKSSNDLLKFLGSFWKNVHEDPDFVKGIQDIRGITLAQRYLDLLECLKLQDRKGLPVFHRELWKPLIIRKSTRNKARENELRVGQDITLEEGPQPSGKYPGSTLRLGELANRDDYVFYPVDAEIETVVSGIANRVLNPSVSWRIGDGPEDVRYIDGTLVFPKALDPFNPENGFEIYDLPVFLKDEEGKDTDESDQETVVWASDVLIDRNYVSEHLSYALGADCVSTEQAKRIVNAAWDAMTSGLTPENLRTLVAAMLDIPVIRESEETVTKVIDTADEKTVVTDAHTYSVYPKAKLRESVKAGAVLRRGDLLDESAKIYPMLTDVSPEKLRGLTEYADILKSDIPVITLPKTVLRTSTAHGISVDWTPVEVLTAGLDKNDHEKLYFELGGSEEDVQSFWKGVWDQAEKDNVDLREIFEAATEDDSASDTWEIAPAAFFLRYLIGANTAIVTLDHAQLRDVSAIRNEMYFNMLLAVVPSGIRLFFIEHLAPAKDEMDFGTDTDDEAETAVALDAEDEIEYEDLPGLRGYTAPSYREEVEMKFIRNRKRSAD